MIRYTITEAQLRKRIDAVDQNWFTKAGELLDELPANPASKDFSPHWSKIKQVFIDLQGSKCCFCEKPLEGKGEQDVEHFRPKAEVRAWRVPAALVAEGVASTVASPTEGYAKLAYHPFNYAAACGTCNSSLKRNYFPIAGQFDSSIAHPKAGAAAKPYLIYPIGTIDEDPENLIEFVGLSPRPRITTKGHKRRRALLTIELFRLDDNTLRELFKLRAFFLRLLYRELEALEHARAAAERTQQQKVIETLISDRAPFAACLRAFRKLFTLDRNEARLIFESLPNAFVAPVP